MEGTAYLVREKYDQDSVGNYVPSEELVEIFVSEGSVTRSEWNAAGQHGKNPSIMLTTPIINYSGEDICIYNNKRYEIYRTYHEDDSDDIELYLQKQVGTA